MPEDQPIQTKPKPFWRRAIIPASTHLLVFAAGAGVVGFVQSNKIYLSVEPNNGRVNLAPQVGDRIVWKNRAGAPVFVKFPGGNPCDDTPTDFCVIQQSTGHYEYNCVDSVNNPSSFTCKDPGIDPQSSLTPSQTITDIVETIKIKLGFRSAPVITPIPHDLAPANSKLSPADTLYPSISCVNSALAVTPDALTNPGDRLTVYYGQTIHWQPGSITQPYIITNDPSICKPTTVNGPDAVNNQCKVIKKLNPGNPTANPPIPPDPPVNLNYNLSLTPPAGTTAACTPGTGALQIVPPPL